MKILNLVFFLVVAVHTLTFAQEDRYFVVHVNGNIMVAQTGKKLAIGDQLDSEEALKFLTQDAKAMVMHSKKGRMLLSAEKTTKNEEGEFISFVKDVLVPGAENIRLSTRGGLNYDLDYRKVNDFKSFFGEDRYVFIGDELKIGADMTRYPVGPANSLVYRYEADGKPIRNRLGLEGNNIVFSKQKLYTARGITINPETVPKAELLYFDETSKKETPLTSFKPIFVDEKTLMLELKSVAGFLGNNEVVEATKIKDELFDFMLEVYGPINRNIFNDWLASKDLFTKR